MSAPVPPCLGHTEYEYLNADQWLQKSVSRHSGTGGKPPVTPPNSQFLSGLLLAIELPRGHAGYGVTASLLSTLFNSRCSDIGCADV